MNKIRVYNDYEMSILLNNHNVDGIKNNSQIIYNNSFKLWAVMQRLNTCKTAKQIFAEAGFDMNIIDERTPQKRIKCLEKIILIQIINIHINQKLLIKKLLIMIITFHFL